MARKKGIAIAAAVVLVIGTAVGVTTCSRKGANLPTATVENGPLEVTVAETGTIQPLTKVEIKSKVAGQVDKILVDVGAHVKKGQLLIQLDTKDMERQRAQSEADLSMAQARLAKLKAGARLWEIKEAQAQLSQREANYRRASEEFRRSEAALQASTITPRDAESARSEYAGARAQLEESRARLSLLKAGSRQEEIQEAVAQCRKAAMALRAAEDQLAYASIRAPMDGTIIRRGIEEGEMVSPGVSATAQGTSMLTVADLGNLIIQSNLNQVDVGKVRLGQKVEIRVDSAPGKVFFGKVWKVAPAAEAEKDSQQATIQTFPVKTRINSGASAEVLRPGMTADIDIKVTSKKTLFLPIEAVVRGKGDEGTVTLMLKKGTKQQQVKLGLSNDHQLEITAGLALGDKVIIKPSSSLENTMKM